MRCAIRGFVGNAALLQAQAKLPAHPFHTLLASATLIFLIAWKERGPLRIVLGAASGAAIRLCCAALLATQAQAPELTREGESRDVFVTGTIDNLPNCASQFTRFLFNRPQHPARAGRDRRTARTPARPRPAAP